MNGIKNLKIIEVDNNESLPKSNFYKALYLIIQQRGGWIGAEKNDLYVAIALQYPQYFTVIPNHSRSWYPNLVMVILK